MNIEHRDKDASVITKIVANEYDNDNMKTVILRHKPFIKITICG
jgi:hypothetical protein